MTPEEARAAIKDLDCTQVFLGVGRAGRYVTLHNAGLGRPEGDGPTSTFLKALDARGLFDLVTIQPSGRKALAIADLRWPQFQGYCARLGVNMVVLGDH